MSDDEEDDEASWEQKDKDDVEKNVYGTTTTARSATLRNGPLQSAVKRRLGSLRREADVETPLPQYTPRFGEKNFEVCGIYVVATWRLTLTSRERRKIYKTSGSSVN